MTRIRIALLAAAAAVLAGATLGSAAVPVPKKLTGTVGPGFTITLKTPTLKVVTKTTTLAPGKYAFVVKDLASIHNFTVKGPGVLNKVVTATSFTGTKTLVLTLKKGTYTYYCSIHPTIMTKTFKVS